MNLGPMEILVILVVALVLFGPSKLPELGKSLGKGIREFKRGTQGLKDELELSLKDEPAARPAAAPVAEAPAAAPAQQTVYAAAPQLVTTPAQAEAAPATAPLRAADLAVSPAVPVPAAPVSAAPVSAAEPAAPQEPAHRA